MVVLTTPRRAVYTVLFGGYENLNDDQVTGDAGLPFICFTDDTTLRSDVWDVRLVEPLFANDLTRSQRNLKIRGHRDLAEFDTTLYIDNSVSLREPPETIIDRWLESADVAIPLHSFRETVLDEFIAVVAAARDDPTRVFEQLEHYAAVAPEILQQKPYWDGMMVRRNSEAVALTMNRWFDDLLRYSRRDQLSANYALSLGEISVAGIELDNHSSPSHVWPVSKGRAPTSAFGAGVHVPDIAHRRVMEMEIADLRARADELYNQLEQERIAGEGRLAAAEVERQGLAAENQKLLQTIDRLQASKSWAVTSPLRIVGTFFWRLRHRGDPGPGANTETT